MDNYESLSHTPWEYKYHVKLIPKCRRRTLYEQLWQHLGQVFHELARQKESRVEEGDLMPDHVQMLLAIPPKYAVPQVVGYIKGKSAIHLARVYAERKRKFVRQNIWAREGTSYPRWAAARSKYSPARPLTGQTSKITASM
jgi:putative transposase